MAAPMTTEQPTAQPTAAEAVAEPTGGATSGPETTVVAPGRPFDPTRHMRQLRGRDGGNTDYLDVKWRIAWLRAEHPEAHIQTDHITITDDAALFRAAVSIPDGGSATGYGSETARDFRDFIEKAETKALGRALAALGYGAAHCADHDTGDAPVDAPIERAASRNTGPARSGAEKPVRAASAPVATPPPSITQTQVDAIVGLARELGLADDNFDGLRGLIDTMFRRASLRDLTAPQGERLIAALDRRKAEQPPRSSAPVAATDEIDFDAPDDGELF